MNPQEAEAELSAWLDGELTPERAQQVEAVVALDARLSTLVEQLRRARAVVSAMPSPEASPRLRANVLSAIAAPAPEPWWRRWLTVPRLSLGALAAVALLGGVWWSRATPSFGGDEEKLLMAQHLELLEDYEVLSLRDAEDLEVIAALKELEEATP